MEIFVVGLFYGYKNISSDRNDETFSKEEEKEDSKTCVCSILYGSASKTSLLADEFTKGSRIESSSEVTRLRITRHGMAKLKSWCKKNTLFLPFFPFSPPSFVVLIRPIEVKFSFPLEIQRLFKMIFFPWKTFHGQFAHNFRTDSSFPSYLRAERNGAPLSSFFVFRRTTWSGRDDFHGINFGRGSF